MPAPRPTPLGSASPLVEVEAVSYRYTRRGALVLDGIDLAVTRGEAVALVGRSGCGKSTLLHLLAGLARPTSGTVKIDGRPVAAPCARWNMMFQAPSLLPWLDVAGNVGLGLRYAGVGRAEIRDRVAELLALVHLEDHAASDVQALSGGQQQRVALARSLATRPDLLLLDEPFSALDPFTRASLQAEVGALADRFGITLVIVTHDVDEAVLLADRALIMAPHPGRVVGAVEVTLPRQGRDRHDPAFRALRQAVLEPLGATEPPPRPDRRPPSRPLSFPWRVAGFGRPRPPLVTGETR
jgi:NitT/TauT family transport system ATP-binding protein